MNSPYRCPHVIPQRVRVPLQIWSIWITFSSCLGKQMGSCKTPPLYELKLSDLRREYNFQDLKTITIALHTHTFSSSQRLSFPLQKKQTHEHLGRLFIQGSRLFLAGQRYSNIMSQPTGSTICCPLLPRFPSSLTYATGLTGIPKLPNWALSLEWRVDRLGPA